MRRLLFAVLSAALLSGCSSARYVVTDFQRDTVYLNKVQYDSVYVFQDRLTDRSRDTVYVKDVQYQYRYKLLRDTCYVHQVDSIPVIREVEVVKTERYVPGIYKVCLWVCIGLVVFIVLFVVKKFFLK